MSSGCQKTGCTRPASKALTINVPAKGWPISLHQPVRMVIGVHLCRQCAATVKAAEFLTADTKIKTVIEDMCRTAKQAEPDFARAFVTPISLDGDEYQNFAALRHGRAS